SDGDAVGYPSPGDPLLLAGDVAGVRVEQRVRHPHGAPPVDEPGVLVPLLHPLLHPPELVAEPVQQQQHLAVVRPRRRRALPEVHLVGGVVGQHLDQRDPQRRREPVGHRLQEEPARVGLQLRHLRRPRERHEPPAPRRPVRRVPGVAVLAEVDGGVQRRRGPDERRQRLDEARDGVEVQPARGVALPVAVAHAADVVPPRLQLGVAGHRRVGVVEVVAVAAHPALDGEPHVDAVDGVRVVLDVEGHAAARLGVPGRHPP
ncbi:Os05g0304701, partial [Oryza sativa Japonica Group]